MKNIDSRVTRALLVAALGIGLSDLCAGATANALNTASDVAGVSSLTNKAVWSDSANWTAGVTDSAQGYRTGVWQPDPATDYVFANNKTLRPPRFNDYRFIGKSLQIGDAATGKLGHVGVGTSFDDNVVQELDFTQSKLIFALGTLGQYYHSATRIHGAVEITAQPDSEGRPTFSFRANQSTNVRANNSGAALEFTGTVTGAADTLFAIQMADYNASYNNLTATNTIIRFTGDISGLHSTVIVRPYSNKERYEWPDTHRATFSTSCAEMPGKLVLWRGGALQLWNMTTAFTVDTVELSGDNRIEIPYDFTTGTGASLNVTNALSVQGVTLIRPVLTGTDDTTKSFERTLITAPAGVTLDAANFALDGLSFDVPYRLAVGTDANGRSILVLRHGVLVTLGRADGNNSRESFYSSKLPHGWSGVASNEWPIAGKDYLDVGLMLRGPNTPNDQTFAGDTLTLRSSNAAQATLALRAPNSVTINDLRLDACYSNDVVISHYASPLNYKTTFPYVGRGMCLLYGNARVSSRTDLNGRVVFQLANSRGFKHGMNLRGDAKVVYQGCVEKAANPPISHHWLAVANSNLTGRTVLEYSTRKTIVRSEKEYNYDWVPAETGVKVPNMELCTHVYIDDPACFGGREPSFTYDALTIQDYSILHPMKSMTFDDPTRGICIAAKTGNAPVARFDVTNDVTLTICQKINFTGTQATLIKEGAGTLVFGEGCQLTFRSAQVEYPDPVSNNIFRVLAGTFKPASLKVCDGLQVSFGADAVLALDADTSNADLLRYGLYNNRWRRARTDRTTPYPGQPLALESGAANYRVRIDGGALAKPPRSMGLLTVGAEYADEIRGRIQVTHPFDGYEATLVETTFAAPLFGGNLVTFSVNFRKGFQLFVR